MVNSSFNRDNHRCDRQRPATAKLHENQLQEQHRQQPRRSPRSKHLRLRRLRRKIRLHPSFPTVVPCKFGCPLPLSFCVGMSQMETRPVIRRVTLFVADETESTQYCKAQQESGWQDVKFIVSDPGIKDSRHYRPGTYVVAQRACGLDGLRLVGC